MEYKIAAIPTIYKGIQFRSRLEARWAAFFDQLDLTWQYEPFDLGTWTPDFLISGTTDALVEVKPISQFDPDTAVKMVEACYKKAIEYPNLLLLGIAPWAEIFDDVNFPNEGYYSHALWLEKRKQKRVFVGWALQGRGVKDSVDIKWVAQTKAVVEWIVHTSVP